MLFIYFISISAFLWQLAATTSVIDGYTDKISAFPGDSLTLYLNASQHNTAYSVGLYNMAGEIVYRMVAKVSPQSPNSERAFETGFGYAPSGKLKVPELKSGLYLWDNKIPFIVKSRNPKIVVVYASNTGAAYCNAGGKSLYGFNSSNMQGASKVSFRRPVGIETYGEAFFRWIAKQDIADIGYISDMDMDDYRELSKSRLLIITGHSEYWTLRARKNFDRFVAEGKDAMVLSGNTMWWQVRYSKGREQLICYRNASADNIGSPKLKTILWNDSTLAYPILSSIGADFSLGGYGDKVDKGWDGYKIINESPLLAGTGLKKGEILPLSTREADGAPVKVAADGYPRFDNSVLRFYHAEVVGFDYVLKGENSGSIATWIVFKPTRHSGTVINVASTNWCSYNGIGRNPQIGQITKTMIQKLLNKENVFSPADSGILIPEQAMRPIE